jgi:hypothetical protein
LNLKLLMNVLGLSLTFHQDKSDLNSMSITLVMTQ